MVVQKGATVKELKRTQCSIRPTRDLLVIEYEPLELQPVTAAGVIATVNAEWKQGIAYRARVLAVGPGRFSNKLWDKKGLAHRLPMTVKAGDVIAITRQNFPRQMDGREVFIVQQSCVEGIYS